MGRRLRTSTTTVIDTELCPLDDSFIIEASGSTEQWYFDNTSQWSPNRRLTPLILTPKLSLYDQDQHQSWTRTANSPDSANDGFSTVQWYAMEWNASAVNGVSYATTESSVTDPRTIRDWRSSFPSAPGRESKIWMRLTVSVNSTVVSTSYSVVTAPYSGPSTGAYVETEITNTTDSPTADYVKVGHTLKVKKNVSYTYAVTIRCVAQYIDPRDNAFTYPVEETVLLTTNRDAEVVFPEVKIISPSAQSFNPLLDYKVENGDTVQDSFRTFEAVVANHPADMGTASNVVQYKVDGWGTEQFLPDNSTKVESLAPEVNIEYPDGSVESGAQFAYRPTANGGNANLDGIANITRMKGDSVVWNQAMTYDKWSSSLNGTISIANGICTYTVVNAVGGYSQSCGQFSHETVVKNHIYYVSIKIKCSHTAGIYLGGDGLVSIGNMTITDTTNWNVISRIATYTREDTTTANAYFSLSSYKDGTSIAVGDVIYYKDPIRIDLTQMFGTGKEPSTVEAFETWLEQNIGKKSYYPYNAGELISVKSTGLKTVGFNQWDEEWESGTIYTATGNTGPDGNIIRSKNFCPCFSNTNYFLPTWNIFWYDENQQFISAAWGRGVKMSPTNARYFKIRSDYGYGTVYNNDICINLSDASLNGTYKSHWERVANINITKVQGTPVNGGAKTVVFPDGLKGIGDVRDEIYVDGGRLRAIKRIGSVDLGNLTYTKNNTNTSGIYRFTSSAISDLKIPTSGTVLGNILCPNYATILYASGSGSLMSGNDGICARPDNQTINIVDSTRNSLTKDEFKTAMDGVPLYYELATPITYDLDAMQTGDFVWYGMDSNHNEVLVETLPWYEKGQGTSVLTVDAMFGEDIHVVLRARKNVNTDALSPSRAYGAVVWKIPDMDIHSQCDEGAAIRSTTSGNYVFRPICNMAGRVLSDSVVGTHLRFNWKYRRENTTTETDAGWGDYQSGHAGELAIASSSLKNVSATRVGTMVYPYAYVLGAWTPVTGSETGSYNRPTTYKNNIQYTRTID